MVAAKSREVRRQVRFARQVSAPREEPAMSPRARRNNVLVILFVARSAFGLGPGRAEAQFGMAAWAASALGWGLGALARSKNRRRFLYSKALVDAQRNTHIPSRDVLRQQSQLLHQSHTRQRLCRSLRRRPQRPGLLSLLRSRPSPAPENDTDGDDRHAADAVVAAGQLLQCRGPHRLARRCTDRRRPERKAVRASIRPARSSWRS